MSCTVRLGEKDQGVHTVQHLEGQQRSLLEWMQP